MGRACRTYGEKMKAYMNFVEKQEGERTLGRTTRMWEDNVKKNLK
jgi:hypothetical protein